MNTHITELLEKFQIIEVQKEKLQQLPFLYWLPKQHKKPSKQRSIAASKWCSTKQLSSNITKCLKLVQKQHKSYCNAIQNFSGFQRFWIIDNSSSFVDMIEKSNLTGVRNIKPYGFSTLYTSIPHSLLKECSRWSIEKAFNGRGKKYMHIYKSSARWTKRKSKSESKQVDSEKLIQMINYLIDNVYVTCGDKVFRQVIGIPMGTDCAPF